MKKTILFLMVIFMTIGAYGCGMKGQDKVDKMVSYINEKYSDDNFEYVSMSGGHLGSNTTKIIVKSEKFPDKEIRVICSESNGETFFSDTYLNIKFEYETRNYIEDSLSGVFGSNVYVQYIPDDTGSIKKGTSNTTFSDYISDSTTYVYFNAVVITDYIDEDVILEKVKDTFSDGVLLGDIYFVESLHLETFTNDPLSLVADKKYKKSLSFIKTDIDHYKTIEWKS